MAFELDSISDTNSAWQYFGTFAKTPQLELSCKKILFFPKCSRMWCVTMSTNCRHDFSTASGIDVTQLWPWSFWEAQKDLWDSASLPDTSREGVYVQISLSGLKPPHQAARTLWRASKCERLQCSILPCPRASEGAWRGCWANPSAAHLHKEHPAGPVEATAQLRLSGVPAGASSRGNSTFGSAWLHIHLGWCEWLQVCCCGSWHLWSSCWALFQRRVSPCSWQAPLAQAAAPWVWSNQAEQEERARALLNILWNSQGVKCRRCACS